MPSLNHASVGLAGHWPVWLLSAVLVIAAVIDGWRLRVPNRLTYPLIIGGWLYGAAYFGWQGLGWSLLGTLVGLALLLPAYAIGGMGAGDVKLLAGVGAWVGAGDMLYAFVATALVGGLIAVGMVLWQRSWQRHWQQFWKSATKYCNSAIRSRWLRLPDSGSMRCFCCRTGFRLPSGQSRIFATRACCYELPRIP
jgi:prepilin peptidase CpaA